MPEETLRITATEEQVGLVIDPSCGPGAMFGFRLLIPASAWTTTLARAVEPFFSTKGVGKGTGLRLSMVHGLASQLGGALTIRARRGVGTNVELWLPVSEAPAETQGGRRSCRPVDGVAHGAAGR